MTIVVCICGSTRFRKEIAEANRKLTMEGKIVLAPGVFQHDGDSLTEGQKSFLDDLHLRKIDMSDEVYVVNPEGYIGSSTARENNYAIKIGKPVTYLVELCDKKHDSDCALMNEPYYMFDTVCDCDEAVKRRSEGTLRYIDSGEYEGEYGED